MAKMYIEAQQNHIKSHGALLKNGQVFLTKPLYAFKKVFTYGGMYDDKVSQITKDVIAPKNCTKIKTFIKEVGKNFYLDRIPAIANLVIPAGAIVSLPVKSSNGDSKKIRANLAYCHSIVRLDARRTQVAFAISSFDKSFAYFSEKEFFNMGIDKEYTHRFSIPCENFSDYHFMIRPNGFSGESGVCKEGIHFFLQVEDALNY